MVKFGQPSFENFFILHNAKKAQNSFFSFFRSQGEISCIFFPFKKNV